LHFNAVDVIVLAAAAILAIDGARRGFGFYFTELFALGIGAGVALSTFGVVGRLFTQVLAVGSQMADLAASLLILVVVHVLVQLVLQPIVGTVSSGLRKLLGRVMYRGVSVVAALAVAALLTVLVVGGLVAVPEAAVRTEVAASYIGTQVDRIDVLRGPMRTLLVPPAAARSGVGQEESS
jgi:hypothetical protein